VRAPGTGFEVATRDALAAALHQRSLPMSSAVLDGLLAATAAPLPGGVALRDLGRGDVATELRFSLPVAPGVELSAIGALLRADEPDGPFATWASHLEGPTLGATLVGSIDLVSTLGSSSRYWVLDYKTNLRAGARGGYGREGLLAAMREADYPLQAALYLVALHRLLRWRVEGYDPARHLGGAHYLFLRGMASGEGVVSWSPSPSTIVALSDLLAGAS
jgi:exodeoxyribonuclease V beta subunit